tara:strand:- start:538 stop:1266 length:729 start_codon:yes stop_codon:yes gene_type:complete
MAYIGANPSTVFTGIARLDTFTGDGSTTVFDLSNGVFEGADNDIQVFVNNVRQKPGSSNSYTFGSDGTSFKRITFNAAPAASAEIYVIYKGEESSLLSVQDASITASKLASNSITGQTELAAEAAADDVLLIFDTSANTIKKIQKSNLASTGDLIQDDDNDTKIQAEESSDEDKLRFDTAGTERLTIEADGKFAFTSAGGGVINSKTISSTYTLTDQNLLLAGPVSITGTITVGSGATMVVV